MRRYDWHAARAWPAQRGLTIGSVSSVRRPPVEPGRVPAPRPQGRQT